MMVSRICYVTILVFLSFVLISAQTPPTAFSATVTWNQNGRNYPVTMYYDSTVSKMALIYNFASGASPKEIYDYNGQQVFRSYNGTCQTAFYETQMFNFYLASGSSSPTVENNNGKTCNKYTIPQPSGWTGTVWFEQSTGLIVSATLSRPSTSTIYTYTFSSVSKTFSSSVFTQASNCQSLSCYALLDLMLVIDDSGSIDSSGWNDSIAFAVAVVNSFQITPNDTNVGVITFSTNPTTQIPLSSNATKIVSALRNVVRTKLETGLSAALNMAQYQLANGRPGVAKAVIVLTDGDPNVPSSGALEAAANSSAYIRASGVTIYAIGVGSFISDFALEMVASSPASTYASKVSTFGALSSIQENLVKSVCTGETRTSCQPDCDANDGFCMNGQCLCTKSCSSLTTGCYQGICNNVGKCTTKAITGCCTLGPSSCNNHGNPNNVTCQVSQSSPCTCDNGNWCINGNMNYQCQCVCDQNWNGGNCNNCNWDCKGRGSPKPTCDDCNCNAPWTGVNCQTCTRALGATFCINGQLNPQTCQCTCDQFWSTDSNGQCTVCNQGAAEANYCSSRGHLLNPSTCDGPCVCQGCQHNGLQDAKCKCNCSYPWTNGATGDCDACILNCTNGGTPNPDCETCSCPQPYNGNQCSGCGITPEFCGAHGTPNYSTCKCDCDNYPLWSGLRCDQCNRNCHGTGVRNFTDCSCDCFFPWGGQECLTCTRNNSYCTHGTINPNCNTCACPQNTGWAGNLCENCNWGCNNGGTPKLDTCDNCTCVAPWSGNTCSTCTRSNSYCNGRGTINQGTCKCNCKNGYSGDDCSQCNVNQATYCVNGAFNSTECGCNCKPYFTGGQCQTCTRQNWPYCTGHGTVNADCNSCSCSGNWTGPNCATCGIKQDYCVNGNLSNSTCSCQCNAGWSGDRCDKCSKSASTCKNGGVLNNKTCSCDCGTNSLWSGETCSSCVASGTNNCKMGELFSYNGQCICSCRAFVNGTKCDTCNANSAMCSGNGIINMTTCGCNCNGEWIGERCTACSITQQSCVGEETMNPQTCTCSCPLSVSVCSGRGKNYQYDPISCTCKCKNNWVGEGCDTCDIAKINCTEGLSVDPVNCGCCKCKLGDGCCSDGCNLDLNQTSCTPEPEQESSPKDNTPIIIGASVGGAALLAAASGAAAFFIMKKKKAPEPGHIELDNTNDETAKISNSPVFQDAFSSVNPAYTE